MELKEEDLIIEVGAKAYKAWTDDSEEEAFKRENYNKHSVFIKHIPTSLVVYSDMKISQIENKKQALNVLKELIEEID